MNSFLKKEYPNGITIVYRRVNDPYFFYLTQYFNSGSKDFPIGLLHFFEHCAFSAPENRQVQEYRNYLQKNNISKEASTSRDFLEFHYSGLQEDWKEISNTFFECFKNKEITFEVFQNEKNRILHEIDEENSNEVIVDEENFALLYKNPEMIVSPLGTKSLLNDYTQDDINNVAKSFLREPFTIYIQSSLPAEIVIDYYDKYLSSLNTQKATKTKDIDYNVGGTSMITLPTLEGNNILEYSLLYNHSYTLNDLVCMNILSEYFSFEGVSVLSKEMRFTVGTYDYSINKLFYKHGILLIFYFSVYSEQLEYVKKNLKNWICEGINISEEEFQALKKKLKFDYLQYISDPSNLFEACRELYQVIGSSEIELRLIHELESINLENLQDFYNKIINNSIHALIVAQREAEESDLIIEESMNQEEREKEKK